MIGHEVEITTNRWDMSVDVVMMLAYQACTVIATCVVSRMLFRVLLIHSLAHYRRHSHERKYLEGVLWMWVYTQIAMYSQSTA